MVGGCRPAHQRPSNKMIFNNKYDDEGSLYAESIGDATEAASKCADDDNTGNKTKKTTAAAVAKPREKRSETSRLESPWG